MAHSMEANPSSKDAASANLQFEPAGKPQKRCCRAARFRAVGFTLIELMAVLVVILVLFGIAIGAASYVQRKGAVARVKAEIVGLEAALDLYKADMGYYPSCTDSNAWSPPQAACTNGNAWSSVAIYRALSGAAGGKVYVNFRSTQLFSPTGTNVVTPEVTIVLDIFGTGYFYRCPGKNNRASFDLWSLGPDRAQGVISGVNRDPDNITNWQ